MRVTLAKHLLGTNNTDQAYLIPPCLKALKSNFPFKFPALPQFPREQGLAWTWGWAFVTITNLKLTSRRVGWKDMGYHSFCGVPGGLRNYNMLVSL